MELALDLFSGGGSCVLFIGSRNRQSIVHVGNHIEQSLYRRGICVGEEPRRKGDREQGKRKTTSM
jgi:hypothetical protein